MKRGAPHTPLPETGGQGHEIDAVSRMSNQPFGEFAVRSAKERLQKQKF